MVLWFILFLIIIAISFVLAYQSMQDYQERPVQMGTENSIFLVRNPNTLTNEMLDEIHAVTVSTGYIVSIEKLLKGQKSALVIFGPKNILQQFSDRLSLIELEEYTNVDEHRVTAWEVGVKDTFVFHSEDVPALLTSMPRLEESEHLWIQFVLQSRKEQGFLDEGDKGTMSTLINTLMKQLGVKETKRSYDLAVSRSLLSNSDIKAKIEEKNKQRAFYTQIRCVLVIYANEKRKQIAESLDKMGNGKLVKIPKPITSEQMLGLYKQRSIPPANANPFILTSQEIRDLVFKQG